MLTCTPPPPEKKKKTETRHSLCLLISFLTSFASPPNPSPASSQRLTIEVISLITCLDTKCSYRITKTDTFCEAVKSP